MRHLFYPRYLLAICAAMMIFFGCSKEDDPGDYQVNNSLTLFKLDNQNNDVNLAATDTVSSQAGVNGKFIPVSGAAGASKGLESIEVGLYTPNDSLLNKVMITSFFKPEYHLINTQLGIPEGARGQVYKVKVTVIEKGGATLASSSFLGLDVVSCDPQAACIVNNQITVIIETPAGTPEAETLYLFGSLNGWSRGDAAFELHKNPDVANCYCVTIPFPPGYSDWQVGEVYVTRGLFENDAVNDDNSTFVVAYTTTELGPLWKIKVPKWRDQ